MMKIVKSVSFMMSAGLAVVLLGCGGGDAPDKVTEDSTQQAQNDTAGGDNSTNTGNETNNGNPVVAGYVAGNGVLVETKSDGTKLAWVNATSTACLIYRISDRGGNILDGGNAHCESLNTQSYAGRTTWRLPEEAEAVYLMAHVGTSGANRIIYPDDNPGCQFMATKMSVPGNDGRFVYTTNRTEMGAFNNFQVQGKLRTTAGIRCVATE